MGRTAGATNRDKPVDGEDIFLATLLREYTYWKNEAIRKVDDGEKAEKEKLYADFFKTGLAEFTKD